MRALIVHGFGKGRTPQRKAEEFGMLVQQSFLRFVSDDVSFDVREYRDLADYLPEEGYDMETVTFPIAFELLDFVFVDGNAKMNPWHHSLYQLRTLIRISLHREKYIFACNVGTLVLTLVINTGEDELSIENGQGSGEIQVDLTKYRTSRMKTPPNFELLESSSGDLYKYSKIECDWTVPYNIGMHKSGIAVLHNTFRVPSLSQERNMKLGVSELSCQKLKAQYGHWIFRDILENDFIVPIERAWNVHNPRCSPNLTPLADSIQGVEIFEYKEAIALNFSITIHNSPAVQLLLNFVAQKLTLLSKQDRLSNLKRGQSCNSLATRVRSNVQTSASSFKQITQPPPKLDEIAEEETPVKKTALRGQPKALNPRKDAIDVIPLDVNIIQRTPVEIGRVSPMQTSHAYPGSGPALIVRKIQGDSFSSSFNYQKFTSVEYLDAVPDNFFILYIKNKKVIRVEKSQKLGLAPGSHLKK